MSNIQKELYYKKNFKFAFDPASYTNYAGYGINRPFVPPLSKPEGYGAMLEKISYTTPYAWEFWRYWAAMGYVQ